MKNILLILISPDGTDYIFIDDINKITDRDIREPIEFCIQNPDKSKDFKDVSVIYGGIYQDGYHIDNELNDTGLFPFTPPFTVEHIVYCNTDI